MYRIYGVTKSYERVAVDLPYGVDVTNSTQLKQYVKKATGKELVGHICFERYSIIVTSVYRDDKSGVIGEINEQWIAESTSKNKTDLDVAIAGVRKDMAKYRKLFPGKKPSEVTSLSKNGGEIVYNDGDQWCKWYIKEFLHTAW